MIVVVLCCNPLVFADNHDSVDTKGTKAGGTHVKDGTNMSPNDGSEVINQKDDNKSKKETKPEKTGDGIFPQSGKTIVQHVIPDKSCSILWVIEIPCVYKTVAYLVLLVFFLGLIILIWKKRWFIKLTNFFNKMDD
ncbi:hypothetical protein QUF74_01630 [Candidatus Halobeggiatoa sp. HSG11]|nr:hypothetical protein [Candidatus Halobeggiatoa sp. HSG11]